MIGRWFVARIRDVSAVSLYDIACPITWETVYMHRGFEERPVEQIFTGERVADAVRRCLAPMQSREGSDGP